MDNDKKYEVIYLPPVYDPKRFREGILEIIACVESLEKQQKEHKGRE